MDREDLSELPIKRQCKRSPTVITVPERARSLVPVNDRRVNNLGLPVEILSLIFEYLPLKDRKSVRQTCKLWNEMSKTSLFAKREKLVFRKNPDDVIAQILSSSSYPFLNLEFQGLKTESLPSINIWKEYGPKIQSLHFHCCNLNFETVKSIIWHCLNLASIEIYESCQDYTRLPNNIAPLIETLKYFNQKGIKRPKLKNFSAQFSDEISCDWWEDLFAVFPNIKHFGSTLFVSEIKPFTVNKSLQLQSLTLYNYSKYGSTWDKLVSENSILLSGSKFPLLWMFKLKVFRTNVPYNCIWTDPSMISWFAFFSWQTDLEVIDLHITERAVFMKSFLFHILKSCPQLRELRINCDRFYDVPKLGLEEAKKFFLAVANLESLNLCFPIEIKTLPVLPTLKLAFRSLTVWNDVESIEYNSFILNHCSKLESIHLIGATNDIVALIFKTQSQLRSLYFNDAKQIPRIGCLSNILACAGVDDSGEKISIQRLQKLEYLEILSYGGQFTKNLISEFQFQRLKTLNLWIRSEVSHTDLCEMFIRLPQLQIVNLPLDKFATVDVDKIHILCKHAKNLISLHIAPDSSSSIDETSPSWKRLFEENSNLRFVLKRGQFLCSNPFSQLSRHYRIQNFRLPCGPIQLQMSWQTFNF